MNAAVAIAAAYAVGAGVEARHVLHRFPHVDRLTVVAASFAWPFATLVELVVLRWLAPRGRVASVDEPAQLG